MITLQELVEKLNNYLEVQDVRDYCPNGLQVEGHHEVRRIATGVSASLATIRAAVEWEADALVVHHGVFWKGGWPLMTGAMREKMQLLLDHQISLLAYHLPLDSHTEVGNNWVAAHQLGLKKCKPFGEFNGVKVGVKGEIRPTEIAPFVSKVEEYYGHEAHKALGGLDEVSSVAIVSGGAHRQIEEAIAEGIDCFITGSFDEPIWHLAHEGGIHFLALGHSNTERIGPIALKKWLEKHSRAEEVRFLDIANPF